MGLYGPRRQQRFYGINGAEDLIPSRGSTGTATAPVTTERANKHSVVWGCTRLGAGLMSTFPVDQYRDVGGVQTEYNPKPPVLTDPGGTKMGRIDWVAASEADLIQHGNAVGLIVERNTARNKWYPEGLPSRIELQMATACSYIKRRDKPPVWRIDGKYYDPRDVYHEKRNVVAGLDVGLPTILYASLSISEGLSMQQYGSDWFSSGGVPKARMRNTAKRMLPDEIADAKQWYRDTVNNGDVLVMGATWEYDFLQAQTAGIEFIEGRNISDLAVCRFFETPGDLIDVNSSGSSITYANITQRNLEYLILKLGPKVNAREEAWSKLLPTPRYVKMNTDALLRMDPQTRATVMKTNIDSRVLTNAEARALDNRKPLTDAERQEFMEIYGMPKTSPTSSVSIESEPSTSTSGGDQTEGEGNQQDDQQQ